MQADEEHAAYALYLRWSDGLDHILYAELVEIMKGSVALGIYA